MRIDNLEIKRVFHYKIFDYTVIFQINFLQDSKYICVVFEDKISIVDYFTDEIYFEY
jgi:hypothetical protein